MAETSASFKILQKYQEAFLADVFSFSVKNVTYMGSTFLLVHFYINTSIYFYSELL